MAKPGNLPPQTPPKKKKKTLPEKMKSITQRKNHLSYSQFHDTIASTYTLGRD